MSTVEQRAAMEVDHILPLARGGPHRYENVQPSHGDCNRRKGAL
jgi:5-methylcytosine-specific restriction endonuclease McrA